ncbi:large conductance mechanosensitive channel protein [Campylobacter pinnipediorum subsp. caledonicus]|uniref:Large-conductance mechanosensitive channel n=1 Tax=Campylobacter pinnipediorum subsp. caledonicus TaxID=1874362 RepID=A0A1S6U8S5_9BACT|nr:large-conductance mechanosensitive channel protein MscL [Campylobacter pinnipediorum]AQW86433.1 large conductance mechanosensitive channel protein [Campylobacter pinnipediorum subsp. caledonicus]AQW88085.1 large conductance mechanosensitive channel protein [Campylobacter pinnipediorum subsp. caledonicus]OPA71528.1 large-conductance mechanosensitive channel MscL [Campylobacter pinnipediorum subsp. caledonicus]
MSFLKEFKDFAVKGNVVDMAIGVVIGTAFGKIVSSLVSDIIMPVVGFLTGGVNFYDLKFIIKESIGDAPAVTINYGNFIQTTVDFLIIALCIFCVIKAMNSFKKKEKPAPEKPAQTPPDIVLLTEIRDLLKK